MVTFACVELTLLVSKDYPFDCKIVKCVQSCKVTHSLILLFDGVFPLGNFSDSLRDAKIAIDLQPSFVKTVVKGKLNFNKMVTSFKIPKILLPRSCSNRDIEAPV